MYDKELKTKEPRIKLNHNTPIVDLKLFTWIHKDMNKNLLL